MLRGDVPSPLNPPPGCPFHTRCSKAEDVCRTDPPPLQGEGPGPLGGLSLPRGAGRRAGCQLIDYSTVTRIVRKSL